MRRFPIFLGLSAIVAIASPASRVCAEDPPRDVGSALGPSVLALARLELGDSRAQPVDVLGGLRTRGDRTLGRHAAPARLARSDVAALVLPRIAPRGRDSRRFSTPSRRQAGESVAVASSRLPGRPAMRDLMC